MLLINHTRKYMNIRQEKVEDYNRVYEVVKKAFESAEMSDGNEQNLVEALRKSEAFIPELSLVAEENGEIAGHIMFTKVRVSGKSQLALAPLSVLPAFWGQGIGSRLIEEGHKIAKTLGYDYSIVLGSAKYYPRFGYILAEEYGIRPPFEVPGENFMAFRLNAHADKACGTVIYAEEFGI